MGIISGIEYVWSEFLFMRNTSRYLQNRDKPDAAKGDLKKAIQYGRWFVSLEGYVSLNQRSVLGFLEKEAEQLDLKMDEVRN